MTLPDPRVLDLLERYFVVGWRDIRREAWRGDSLGYAPNQTAVGTTNGAGARNVQIFVLSQDLVVLHVLPGFWHPDDLLPELELALQTDLLWRDPERTREQKEDLFVLLHRARLARTSAETLARSTWQGFDVSVELHRAQREERLTVARGPDGKLALKPTCVLLHEQIALEPFVPFAEFDFERWLDRGTRHYDNNRGFDEGRRIGE